MRKFFISLLILISPTTSAEGDAGLDTFFESYVGSYAQYFNEETGGDISVIMQYFRPQTLQVPPNAAPRLTPDHGALARGFNYFLNKLQKKGAVGIRWENVQYVKFEESHALASNIANVYDKSGKVIDRVSSVYSLYKGEASWRIFMIQSIKPEQAPLIKAR